MDPQYAAILQQQTKEVLADKDNAVFTLLDRSWVNDITQLDPATMTIQSRHGLERVLDMSVWLDQYRPEIRMS